MSEEESNGLKEMSLEEGAGPDRKTRDAAEEKQIERDLAEMSDLDGSPAKKGSADAAKALQEALSQLTAIPPGEAYDKLRGDGKGSFSWDGKRVEDLTADELSEVRKVFEKGGVKV